MDERIGEVITLVEADPAQPLTLDELSQKVGLSPSGFRHLFEKETGQSFTDFRREAKLQTASRLLTETYLNISEICYRVGYSDHTSFSKAFKGRFSVTPTEYRKKFHEATNAQSTSSDTQD